MKKIILFTILLIISLTTFSAEKADWTVMVYLAADNNLDNAILRDLNEIEKVGSIDGKMNVIALIDRWSGRWMYGLDGIVLNRENTRGVRVYHMQQDDNMRVINSPDITEEMGFIAGDADFVASDPTNLENFIKKTMELYPADKYILDIGGHGGGIGGVITDDHEKGGQHITRVTELRDLLGRTFANVVNTIVAESNGEVKLNVLSFDACLMSMYEVYYEMAANNIGYTVASEASIAGSGFSYDNIFSYLRDDIENNGIADDGEDYSKNMVDQYFEDYSDNSISPADLSSIKLVNSILDNANQKVADVFNSIYTEYQNTEDEEIIFEIHKTLKRSRMMLSPYRNDSGEIDYYEHNDYIDLIDLLLTIKDNELLSGIVDEDDITEAIMYLRQNIVAHKSMGPDFYSERVHGYTVYIPFYKRGIRDGVPFETHPNMQAYIARDTNFLNTPMGRSIFTLTNTYLSRMSQLSDEQLAEIEGDF